MKTHLSYSKGLKTVQQTANLYLVLDRLVPLDAIFVAVFVDDVEVGEETGGVPETLLPVGVLIVGVELALGVPDFPLLRSFFSISFTLSFKMGRESGGKPKDKMFCKV